MKLYRNLILWAAGICFLGLFSSCTRELPEAASSKDGVLSSFKAEIAADYIREDLRSTVNVNTGASAFQSGDEVLLTQGSTTGLYRYDGSSFVYVEGTQFSYFPDLVAFFPASIATKGEGKSFNLNLNAFAQQAYSTTGVMSDLPMFGRFLNLSTCRFYNLCTILKISAADGAATEGKTIASVTFTSHEATLTGAALCENSKIVMAADGGKTITMTGSPASLGTDMTWYLKLPAQTYPGGFELSIAFTDGFVYTYSTSHSITLRPGYISPMEAFACTYFSGGSGSKANPYRIATKADLLDMRTKITTAATTDAFRDKHYILLADVDFAGGVMGTIGTETSQTFTGSFDGQGHTISNVVIGRDNRWPRCGFFGTLNGGTLRRLTLRNVSNQITGTSPSGNDSRYNRYTALLAAQTLNGALIEDCHIINGTVRSDSTAVGAIAGELKASVVRNCSVTNTSVRGAGGTNDTAQWGTGGLIGIIDGDGMSTISGCSFNGSVTVIPAYNDNANRAGGLIGVCIHSCGTEIENCSFSGTLSSEGGAVGGIAGQINGNTCIRHCTVAAGSTITGGDGANNIGGIVGYVSAKVDGYGQGEIASCQFKGSVTGSGQQTAGIVGRDEIIPIHDCLVEDGTITGCNNVGGVAGILKNNDSRSNRVISCVVQSSASTVGGIVASLQGSAYMMDCSVEGTNVTSTYDTGATDTAANAGGIAGWVGGGSTSAPTRIVSCHSTGGTVLAPGRRVGGIAAVLAGPSLVNECWSDMNIDSGKGHAGGIVGSFDPGKDDMLVINCSYFGGFVRETTNSNGAVAGIVGSVAYTYAKGAIQNGYVVNCYANPVSVSTAQYATGGIGGYLCRHNVDNCFSPIPSSALTATGSSKYKGGAVGIMRRGGRTVNCYAVYQSDDSNDGYDSPEAANVIWKVTKLSDADAKASSASVVVPSTGVTAASLIDALNRGADLYNNGGNATDLESAPYHGSPKYGVLAKPWAQGREGYPVPVCSPLFNGSTDGYAHTVTVENPNLTIFMPPMDSKFTGKCVVVMPGGGYHNLPLAASREGDGWASYYNNLGFACAVLRYTLPAGNPDLPITDAENAIKYVREHSSSLHINSVGVQGFSAGGHLASTIATHYTTATRPDFQILFYPVITMGTGTHGNSKNNFLGTSPSDAMVTLYSNQLQVTADTPKTFLMYYDSDSVVTPSANGEAYYNALTAAGVSVTRKVFSGSTHGWNDTDKVDGKTARQHLTTWLGTL